MSYFRWSAIILATLCLSSQVQSQASTKKEKPAVVRQWAKPASVFGAYRPGKVPYHRRYARSLSFRGGNPRERFQSLKGKKFYGSRSLTMSTTGYIFDPKTHGYNTTATGLWVKRGAIAVDPRVIPLGTYLYVEGYGYGFACDVGGAIKGNKLDLVFSTREAAMQWGRRPAKVWILAAK